MNSTTTLVITPEFKIEQWRAIIQETLASGENVIAVGDTETTGLKPRGNKGNKDVKDRLLEVAFILFKGDGCIIKEPLLDCDGVQIFFHEYINPFIEDQKILSRYNSITTIPNDVILVHGITKSFLEGESGLLDSKLNETSFKLKSPAPTFSQIKPFIERLFCLDLCNELSGRVCLLVHNVAFDFEFLDAEWGKTELLHENNSAPAGFESYFKPIDSLDLIKNMYKTRDLIRAAMEPSVEIKIESKKATGKKIVVGYNLEFLRYFYEVDDIPRDIHGAMVDSLVLSAVYKKMTNDENYKKQPVIRNLTRPPVTLKVIDCNGIIQI